MTGKPIRRRLRGLFDEMRHEPHRQMARNFAKSIILLGIAMLAAVYSNSTARDGRIVPSAIGAFIAMAIAIWVGVRFVPRLASGVDWDWLPFFTQYRVTRDGWIFIVATTVVMSAAINASNNLLYMVLSALLAVMLLSGFLSGLNFRFIVADVHVPENCFANKPFQVSATIRNPRRIFPAFSLQVLPVDDSPFEFAPYYVPLLRTRDQDTRMIEAVLPGRGRYSLEELKIRSRYPFGFLLKGRPFAVAAETIVFPEIIEQDTLDIKVEDILGSSERFERGHGMDLYMIRDYLSFDSARHVDWKASARAAALKTREFAAEDSRRIVLAFDRYGFDGDRKRFERQVSEAASVAFYLIRDGIELSLVADDWRSPTGRSDQLLESILSYLALVESNPTAPSPDVGVRDGVLMFSLRAPATA